jgi:hypothetical protein
MNFQMTILDSTEKVLRGVTAGKINPRFRLQALRMRNRTLAVDGSRRLRSTKAAV